MSYSPELVAQIRADDSWQCIDCKACIICNGTGDPVSIVYFVEAIMNIRQEGLFILYSCQLVFSGFLPVIFSGIEIIFVTGNKLFLSLSLF